MDKSRMRSLQDARSCVMVEAEAESLGEDFRLPISHRIEENLDTTNLQQSSVETFIPSHNLGYKMLQRMGWQGQGLGKNEQGIREPIRAGMNEFRLGVGRQEEENQYTAAENIERKKLEVEMELTEEDVKKREAVSRAEAEREQKTREEVKEIQKVFLCELCNKQYKLAMEMEVHLSSYDHNHKKRMKELKETERARDDKQLRLMREKQRQEREMARLAALTGAKQVQMKTQLESQTASAPLKVLPAAGALKFGFGMKAGGRAGPGAKVAGKPRAMDAKVAALFGGSDDED